MGYLAALLDREGTITLKSQGEYWHVSVNNTEKEIIDWLATIGGTTSSQSQGKKRKVMLIWTLANQKDVHDLLSAVLPHLKISAKRDKAQRAIIEISTRGTPPIRPGAAERRNAPETSDTPYGRWGATDERDPEPTRLARATFVTSFVWGVG